MQGAGVQDAVLLRKRQQPAGAGTFKTLLGEGTTPAQIAAPRPVTMIGLAFGCARPPGCGARVWC